jgi:type IV pilus assembly protein PilV
MLMSTIAIRSLRGRTNAARATHWQRGVSMIEVLVTIVVLSVGLLGAANLQLLSLRTHYGAYERTQATNIAYMVADLARANRSTVLAGGVPDEVIERWLARGDEVMAGANITLAVLNAATGEIRISISWLDDRADDAEGDGIGTFTLTTRI